MLLGRTCSALLFSDFVEEKHRKGNEKNIAFCWFEIKIAIKGDSLCFHAYVYFKPC
jgi:hypothetical protein